MRSRMLATGLSAAVVAVIVVACHGRGGDPSCERGSCEDTGVGSDAGPTMDGGAEVPLDASHDEEASVADADARARDSGDGEPPDPDMCGDAAAGYECDASVSPPVTLSTPVQLGVSVAVDATHVYWTIYSGVYRMPLGGGTSTRLAGASHATGMAIDATSIYWADSDSVKSMPLTGGAPVTLASPANTVDNLQAMGVAIDRTTVYFAANYGPRGGTIWSVPKAGGTPARLASGLAYPELAIAVDATGVYWANHGTNPTYTDSSVMRAPLTGVPDGGTPTVLAAYPDVWAPRGIAINGSHVYWADGMSVKKVRKTGGCVTTLAPREPFGPFFITVDGANVYWSDQGAETGFVRKMPIAGGCITAVAKGSGVMGIAVDGTSVYYVNQGYSVVGYVAKAAK